MDDLVKAVLAFRDERDWKPFHNPKDLAISIRNSRAWRRAIGLAIVLAAA